MPDPDREIYPNAPLQLVAFELRFPPVRMFDASEGQEAVYRDLRELLPILGPPPVVQIDFTSGAARQEHRGVRLLDRRRVRSATILPEAITVETSAYERFESFVELILRVLVAAHRAGDIPAVVRAGLRYIDEIVVPGLEGHKGWSEYVDPRLLAPVSHFNNLTAREFRGAAQFDLGDDHGLGVTFGLTRQRVVDPRGPLRIKETPDGEYFLLDVDSFWTAPAEELPAFDANTVVELCERLHDPIRSIFERSITDKLRNEVLRREPSR